MSKFPEAMHHNEYIDIFPASNDFCDKMKEKKMYLSLSSGCGSTIVLPSSCIGYSRN